MNPDAPPPKSASRPITGKPAITSLIILITVTIIPLLYQVADWQNPSTFVRSASADALMKKPRPQKKSTGLRLLEIEAGAVAENERALTEHLPLIVAMDPLAAARWAESLPPGTLRNDALRRLAKTWAEFDLTAATAWGACLDSAGERLVVLSECVCLLSQTDPAAAMAMIEKYDLSADHQNIENVALLWANKDLPAASHWASGLPEGLLREQALARISCIQAQTDPAGAATLIAGEMNSEFPQVEAAVSVIHQWAQTDYTAAAAWAEQFPDGPTRDRIKRELAGQLSRQTSGN